MIICCVFYNKILLDFDEFFYLKDVFYDVIIVIELFCGMYKVILVWIFNLDLCINIYLINWDKMNISFFLLLEFFFY